MHVGGSLLVVFNSARLVREGEDLEPHLPASEPAEPKSGAGSPQPPAPALAPNLA
jgi:hypothetical protein